MIALAGTAAKAKTAIKGGVPAPIVAVVLAETAMMENALATVATAALVPTAIMDIVPALTVKVAPAEIAITVDALGYNVAAAPGRNGGGGGGGGGIDGCTGAGCGCSVSGGCHGGDKDGDRDGDNKPTSTASCIVKQTASICAEYCTVITDIAMATMTSCTSTACVPTIGCEPTGTTTTITSMSSDECLHVTPPATFPPNVDPYNGCAPCLIGKAIHGPGIIAQDNIIARDLSQPTYVSLHKRGAAETVTNIGSCTFAKGNSALAPAYTGATQYIAHAISNSLPKSQQMPRWYSKTDSDCVPVVTQVPDADVVGRNGNSKRPSIEHVCKLYTLAYLLPTIKSSMTDEPFIDEKNWLGDFFKYLIQVQGWSCEEFQEHMFMPCNSLQLVYDGLASNRHWDFIGVTAELNIIKTAIGGNWEQDIITNADNALGTENTKITPHTPWAGAKGKLSERMLVLQRLVIACDIWTSDYTFNPLDRTNSRIYSILFNINQPKLPVIYKYWMEHIRVGGVMAIAKKYVDLLVASIEDGLNNSAQKALEVPGGKETWDEWHTSLQRMKDVYKLDYLNDESVCTRPIKLTWKRVPLSEGSAGLGARDVCPLPSAPNTPTPTKATATMDEPPRTPENPSQTSRKPQDPPLPTEPSGGYYCFRDHNENKRWNSFGKEEASKLVVDLCSIADLLPTSNTFGYALRGNNGLVASVTWAQDQTGCSLKFDLPLNTYCAYMFKAMLDACGDLNSDKAYGGAFVDKSKYGCVTWWLGADSTASQDRLLTLGQQSRILTQPEKEAHREMLATLEPELPRLKKEVQG
ncbi:hypothetical protein TRV_07102 [Trichophyton verrucosum HKI 0517]|uniref:Uncharacterized protein n=1 Tax=Trichophyton verrucosum (strain HKI 0517) TaxID=663202 RepID=D4DIU1_TRIVH|nr:uncharacterized protein TRV_07102 [Trichophyton verrucosum HKI 0517]EFE38231.1 hypothetical protein TRV_07102 [Trichophyton verrucosum HKI 0517]